MRTMTSTIAYMGHIWDTCHIKDIPYMGHMTSQGSNENDDEYDSMDDKTVASVLLTCC